VASSFKAQATLFVTQPGVSWGRLGAPVIDDNRLASLTALYAQLAQADPIRRQLNVNDTTRTFSVAPVNAPQYVSPAILPLLTVTAVAPSSRDSINLANAAANRFSTWLVQQQAAAKVATNQRIQLQLVDRARKATDATHRSRTLPAVIFLGLMAATLGLVFVRENLRLELDAPDPAPSTPPARRPASNGQANRNRSRNRKRIQA